MLATAITVGVSPAAHAAHGRQFENHIAHLINNRRADHDRVKLKWGRCLDNYAEAQARWMARHQTLQHQDLRPVLKKCHMRAVGENIAVGYYSAKSVTKAWMHSPGHRKNILRKVYRRYGMGAYKDHNGVWWFSNVFGRHA
jgi:uncharacterized protein YkwD